MDASGAALLEASRDILSFDFVSANEAEDMADSESNVLEWINAMRTMLSDLATCFEQT